MWGPPRESSSPPSRASSGRSTSRAVLEPFTPRTPTTRKRLVQALKETRRTGCSVSDGDVVLGMAAVGAPIYDHRGSVCAALSMSGPRPTILGQNLEASRELIVSGASETSAALGFASERAVAAE
jgi:DNA-binding IclR family transcriptional regulator